MENKYFQQALSAMVNNAAYGDAVRHMHDIGMSAEEIHQRLDYPVSVEKIKSVILDYEKKIKTEDFDYEYIEQQDEFGRRSFVRVKKR